MKLILVGSIVGALAGTIAAGAEAGDIRGKGGKCIDIPDGVTKPGTRVHYYTCDGSPEQQWQIRDGQIRGKDGMCLDVPDGDTRDGTRIHIWKCDGSKEQRWTLTNGEIRIGSKCLDLPDGATRDRTPIHLWPCDGSPEQKWQYQVDGASAAPAAPPKAANVLGRAMALMMYAEKCQIPTSAEDRDRLGATVERMQSAAGVPEKDMDMLAGEVRKVMTAPCDDIRAGFTQSVQDTIALASAIR